MTVQVRKAESGDGDAIVAFGSTVVVPHYTSILGAVRICRQERGRTLLPRAVRKMRLLWQANSQPGRAIAGL